MIDKLLMDLNKNQKEAVITTDIPLKILAGAGSGKTRVIIYKIIYLIKQKNISSSKILAVTFTNKAANEMKERIKEYLCKDEQGPTISTFHSFCTKILRFHSDFIGINKNFKIIETNEKKAIIKKVIENYNLNIELKYKNIGSIISFYKSKYINSENIEKKIALDYDEHYAILFKFYKKYLEENDLLDFDDLLINANLLLENNNDVLEYWQKKYDYILVDEFQDTNDMQFKLIKLLIGNKNCLTVVGDPDQTIYSWRGAKVDIILNFNNYFKNSKTITLDQNYRSTKSITNLATDFIKKNVHREDKSLFTNNPIGEIVKIKECCSQKFEAMYVADKICELIKSNKYKYQDIYVIYRINALSGEFEREFQNRKIPFTIRGSFRFSERFIIKFMVALLSSISHKDNFSLEYILPNLPKVGKTTLEKLLDNALSKKQSLYQYLTCNEKEALSVSKKLDKIIYTLKQGSILFDKNEKIEVIMKYLINSVGYIDYLKEKQKENKAIEDIQYINYFLDQLKNYDELYEQENIELNRIISFLNDNVLNNEHEEDFDNKNKVTLLTIHSAKGLENKVVFIIGMNEGIFPTTMNYFSLNSLEEERRVFYVAITRAKELLYITYVKSSEYNYSVHGCMEPSRFIRELNPSLYELEENIFYHSLTEKSSYIKEVYKEKESLILNDTNVTKNDKIIHSHFGLGTVLKVIDKIMIVKFDNYNELKNIFINSNSWQKK